MSPRTRKWLKLAGVIGVIPVLLVVTIDDWGRDLDSHEAVIVAGAGDPDLRPLRSERSTDELILAIRGAARRIRNWEYSGQARDGGTASLMFVSTHRIFRIKDDIIIRVEDRGDHRQVTGVAASRLEIGDLGRNPRHLKRLLGELRGVLEGAVPPGIQGGSG